MVNISLMAVRENEKTYSEIEKNVVTVPKIIYSDIEPKELNKMIKTPMTSVED